MLTLIHNNPLSISNGTLTVDRKFHTGMLKYVEHLQVPITSVNPLRRDDQRAIDEIDLRIADLPYKVVGIELNARSAPTPNSRIELEGLVRHSDLVVGYGYDTAAMTKRHGVRFIACLEYDLQTQLVVARSFARSPLHAAWAMLKCTRDYYGTMIPAMRSAHLIHCNGYPIFNESAPYNSQRLLYLDSRMTHDMVISESALNQRLAQFGSRPVRLIYSGRYEKMKGALDVVASGMSCLDRGLDIELDCYGAGSLLNDMRRLALPSEGRIRVNDSLPFPELVERSKEADLFVSCHIQSDPSCTYLESMGSGLPIVGYPNRMWTSMARASGSGVVASASNPSAMAAAISELVHSPMVISEFTQSARRFALAHCFESEFRLRTDSIMSALRA